MKIIFSLFFILSLSFSGISQDYMEKIAQKSCECVDNISDTLAKDVYSLKLGLCIMNAAEPYNKQIKKDYKIDLSEDMSKAEKLGQIVGLKMAAVCPETLMKLTSVVLDEDETMDYDDEYDYVEEDEMPEGEYGEGVITKIEEEFFVAFSLKDETGKTEKVYWLDYVDSEFDLMANYKSLVGQTIYYFYETRELYDPRIAEYRDFKVLIYVELDE